MKSSASAVASMPVKASCSRAVDWLPCMLSTRGTGVVPRYPVGTCTMASRARPPMVGWRVTVPGEDWLPHPVAAEPPAADVDGPDVPVVAVAALVAGADVEGALLPAPPQATRTTARATIPTAPASRPQLPGQRSMASALYIRPAPCVCKRLH